MKSSSVKICMWHRVERAGEEREREKKNNNLKIIFDTRNSLMVVRPGFTPSPPSRIPPTKALFSFCEYATGLYVTCEFCAIIVCRPFSPNPDETSSSHKYLETPLKIFLLSPLPNLHLLFHNLQKFVPPRRPLLRNSVTFLNSAHFVLYLFKTLCPHP